MGHRHTDKGRKAPKEQERESARHQTGTPAEVVDLQTLAGNRAIAGLVRGSNDAIARSANATSPAGATGAMPIMRRNDRDGGQKFRGTVSFEFTGHPGVYDPTYCSPNPSHSVREWVGARLTVYSHNTSAAGIARGINSRISKIHRDVWVVPGRKYRYAVTVQASTNGSSVTVDLKNREQHVAAGLEAKAKQEADTKAAADAQAAAIAAEKAKRDAAIADMKFIIAADGTGQLVARPVWMAEQRRLTRAIRGFAGDLPVWRAELNKAYNDVGVVGQISYAASFEGLGRPELGIYWTWAQERHLSASVALAQGKLDTAHHEISMALWSVQEAQKKWNTWVKHSVKGAGRVVFGLKGAKYAGIVAGAVLSGGTTLEAGLVYGSLQAGGFAMAFDWADQRGNIWAGSRESFDAWRTGKIGAAGFFLNFFGGMIGDKVGATALAERLATNLAGRAPALAAKFPALFPDLLKFVPNSVFQELGTSVLGGIDPETFSRPDQVVEKIANDPTFLNAMMLWGEKLVAAKAGR